MPDDGTFEIVGTCLLDSDANMQLLIPWCNFLEICLVEIHGFKTVGIICMISYMESGYGCGCQFTYSACAFFSFLPLLVTQSISHS